MKKNIQKLLIAASTLALFAVAPAIASAASSGVWDTGDCPSAVVIANRTSLENTTANCWGSSINAKAGDQIDVRVIYHNNSNSAAPGTYTSATPASGPSNALSINGYIISGSSELTNGVVVNFTDGPHTLSLTGVIWYPGNPGTPQNMPTSASQNLGTIPAGAVGNVDYKYQVSGTSTGTTGGACTINSFTSNPASITSGSSASLSWSTSNCGSVSIVGGRISGNYPASGTQDTGSLSTTTTFVLTATGGGASPSASAIVNVHSAVTSNCSISSFYASPSQVSAGASSTLTWSTTGCAYVSIAGGTISGNQPISGSISTGPIYNTTTFVITASPTSGASVSQSVTVSTTGSGSNCTIGYFNANPNVVQYGGQSTLSWSTSGNCSSVSITGGSLSGGTQPLSGSIMTGAIYGTTTYTLTAYSSGAPVTQSQTVTVGGSGGNCSISSFYASPSQVSTGQSTTLYWNTSGCTSAYVTGPGVNSYNLSGSVSTGAIYGTTTYTITAYGTTGGQVTQSITVTNTYYNGSGSAPIANTLSATPGADGTSETLNGYISVNNACGYYSYSCSGSQTTYDFQYGTSQYSLYSTTPMQNFYGTSGSVTAYLTGLQPNTTYYYQLIASNNYGSTQGGVLSFVTNNNGYYNGSVTVATSLATNITSRSARLNGLVSGSQYMSGTTYFQYGTSPSFGSQTTTQNISGQSNNYWDIITTSPDTTYYYRIVATVNGQTYYGSSVAFTTPGATNGGGGTTIITRTIGTGGGSAFVSLNITDQSVGVAPGDNMTYTIAYQNVSSSILTNATLSVILPAGVTFTQSTQGVLTTNNTVVATLGTLAPGQQGTVSIFAKANDTDVPGSNLVTTATLAFTTPGNAQDSAIAYVLNNVVNRNSLAGLALFGGGFFPTTLLGWILLLGLILLLILLARYMYDRSQERRMAMAAGARAPMQQHNYYSAPQNGYHAPENPNQNYGGYPGDHLPH